MVLFPRRILLLLLTIGLFAGCKDQASSTQESETAEQRASVALTTKEGAPDAATSESAIDPATDSQAVPNSPDAATQSSTDSADSPAVASPEDSQPRNDAQNAPDDRNPPSAIAPSPGLDGAGANDVLGYINQNADVLGLCDGKFDPEISENGSAVYSLGDEVYLVQVMCFLGAYQGSYEYLSYAPSENGIVTRSLEFTVFIPDADGTLVEDTTKYLAGFPTYDAEAQQLNVFTKYRGLGDCGAIAQYEWKEQQFQLRGYWEKSICDGVYEEDASDYQQIFPAIDPAPEPAEES